MMMLLASVSPAAAAIMTKTAGMLTVTAARALAPRNLPTQNALTKL